VGELVRDTGEFTLIDRLIKQLPERVRVGASLTLGIGDDAAVWTPEPGKAAVLTTDALVEGVHFRLAWTDWFSLGHKMLAVNISDIAAMGAIPRLATIVLGLTGNERVSDLEHLYRGAGEIAAAYGVAIAGGDVVRVPHDLALGVTLIGEVEPDRVITRSGARPGDLIAVSGTLGASAAGLALLGQDPASPASPATTAELLIASHLRPVPRVALGRVLHASGVTAAMDLSDGLLGDIRKILVASGVSGEVDVETLPVLPAVRALFPDRYLDLALTGGEDYELLMTVPPDRFDELRQRAGEVDATVTAVGRVLDAEDGPRLILVDGEGPRAVSDGSWDHFSAASGYRD
jgi:thiamine-monophosphate kinase